MIKRQSNFPKIRMDNEQIYSRWFGDLEIDELESAALRHNSWFLLTKRLRDKSSKIDLFGAPVSLKIFLLVAYCSLIATPSAFFICILTLPLQRASFALSLGYCLFCRINANNFLNVGIQHGGRTLRTRAFLYVDLKDCVA